MTLVVPSPAVGFAFVGEGAGMGVTSGDGLEADAGWHLDGDWDAGASGRVVAQLTFVVPPPAVGFAFVGEGAGMANTNGNGLEADAGWHLDGDWG